MDADFRNNVVYDCRIAAGYGEFDRLNYVANYLKPGPSTMQKRQLFLEGEQSVAPGSLYLTGNVLEGNDRATNDNWRATGFYYERAVLAATAPFPAPPITTESANAAYSNVLQNTGASSPARDAIDTRVVREVRTGTGHIVDSVDAAGGWLPSARIADSWRRYSRSGHTHPDNPPNQAVAQNPVTT